MKSLVRMLEDMGMTNVVTYIQSGNAMFQSASTHREEIAQQLKAEIDRQYGFAPHVIILTREELRAALEGNPYPDATSSPNTLHIFFLASEPESPRIDRLEDLRTPNERFTLLGKVFYLHTLLMVWEDPSCSPTSNARWESQPRHVTGDLLPRF